MMLVYDGLSYLVECHAPYVVGDLVWTGFTEGLVCRVMEKGSDQLFSLYRAPYEESVYELVTRMCNNVKDHLLKK
jgi:hypothetical protein